MQFSLMNLHLRPGSEPLLEVLRDDLWALYFDGRDLPCLLGTPENIRGYVTKLGEAARLTSAPKVFETSNLDDVADLLARADIGYFEPAVGS